MSTWFRMPLRNFSFNFSFIRTILYEWITLTEETFFFSLSFSHWVTQRRRMHIIIGRVVFASDMLIDINDVKKKVQSHTHRACPNLNFQEIAEFAFRRKNLQKEFLNKKIYIEFDDFNANIVQISLFYLTHTFDCCLINCFFSIFILNTEFPLTRWFWVKW